MKEISLEDMKKIYGGGSSVMAWIAFGIGSLIAFIAGIADGYTRPLGCK